MIAKSDWEAVRQRMSDEDLQTLGEPPTAEEVLAYGQQKLSEEDAERVRAWLVCNPELARALVQPFPGQDAKPGQEGFLSHAEVNQAWSSVQARIHPQATARRLKFVQRWLGVAAAMVILFAGLFLQTESKLRRRDREENAPRVVRAASLQPDGEGRRGAPVESSTIRADGRDLLLQLPLPQTLQFEQYRLQMADARTVPARELWKSEAIGAESDELAVVIPGASLKPGKYRIVIYGVEDGRDEPLDSYTIVVVP